MKDIVIDIHDLTVAYDYKPVLWNIDLKLPSNELICIVGPNGAGKSTLLKVILKLVKPITGNIIFNESIKNNSIAYVPQCESVDWDFPTTSLDVVMMGRYKKMGWFKRPKKEDRELAFNFLDKVGMREYANHQISNLSGGQQQRVFLARALIQDASIYFLDEPFKGVDTTTEKVIVKLLKDLKKQGKTIVVVHHDLRTVKDYFDSIIFINKEVIAYGDVSEVFNEENINRTYNSKEVVKKEYF